MEKEIAQILVDNSIINNDGKEILPDDDLIDMGLDSFNCIQLIVILEEKYGIEFNDADLSVYTVSTVSKIVEYIKAHQAKAE